MSGRFRWLLAFALGLGSISPTLTATAGDCSPRGFSSDEETVLEAYIGYYGRPADTGGLAYWATQVGQAGGLAAVIDAFGNSAEFTQRFGGLDNATLVDNIYQQAFGRAADSGGLAFYVGELAARRRTLQSIALDIIFGAQNDDATVIQNRLQVSEHLATRLEAAGLQYVDGATTLLNSVTAGAATRDAACASASTLVDAAGGSGGTASISGTIRIDPNNFADSDTNDSDATQVANDTLASAQTLSASGVVGGYAALARVGARDGYAYQTGDVDDWYRLDAGPGTTLILSFPEDPASNDLDLYLYDTSGNLVDGSLGTNSIESLTLTTGGSYFVNINAFAGASIYSLRIGIDPSSAASVPNRLRLSDPFVPGEVIAQEEDGPEIQAQGASGLSMATAEGDLDYVAGAPSRPMLYRLGGARSGMTLMGGETQVPAALVDKLATLRAIKDLRRRAGVRYAVPNFIRQPMFTPNDQYFNFQWDFAQLGMPRVWDITQGSQGVIVAVVDTGVLLNHPDLQGQLIAGADFISDATRAADGDGIDTNPNDVGDGGGQRGSSFHGTHVAGTVAAATNNGTGVAGIAPGVRIMPLRVLGVGGGTDYDIAQALRYAAGLSNDLGSVPAQRADVVNMSLGGPNSSQAMQDVITQVRNQGVIIVAAAGNEHTSTPKYPASYSGVVSVSATTYDKSLAPYSNFGSTVDIAAPGGDVGVDLNGDGYGDGILSTLGTDQGQFIYNFYQGTSMASPHMAGVVALMKSVYGGLSPADLDTLIASGKITEDLGAAGRDDSFGYGLIDPLKAVQEAQALAGGGGQETPVLGVAPQSLNFGTSSTVLTLTLSNRGGGTLSVSQVYTSDGWLTATAAQVDAQGLGTYNVGVDRSGLSQGNTRGTVYIASGEGTKTVDVIVGVSAGGQTVDSSVGQVYVLLVDRATGNAVSQDSGVPSSQGFGYRFDGVAPGEYDLVAGTDMNYDQFICDAGEACGAYPNLDTPASVTVAAGDALTQRDFTVGFLPAIRGSAASAGLSSPRHPVRRPVRIKGRAR